MGTINVSKWATRWKFEQVQCVSEDVPKNLGGARLRSYTCNVDMENLLWIHY